MSRGEPTLRTIGLAFALCGWLAATPADAQEETQRSALSGGFDLIELRAGKGDELSIWDASFSYGNRTDQVVLMTSGGGTLGNQIDECFSLEVAPAPKMRGNQQLLEGRGSHAPARPELVIWQADIRARCLCSAK